MSTEAAFWVLVFSYVWKNLGYTIVLWNVLFERLFLSAFASPPFYLLHEIIRLCLLKKNRMFSTSWGSVWNL